MHPLPRLGSFVGREQEYFLAARTRGDDHALAQPELHLSRRQVGHAHNQPAHEFFGLIRFLDAGEDRAAVLAAKAED